ncbi:hypothetical protein CDL15_Pgr006346 [Punica granatum]|uniref:Uncharacterized protein n=1 Tax=Punica granatum TaxID=22663 RepID=A0A218WA17_PUNGR|nr:hypothetical protein CDL15_Pgr006346 [Punica granatum]
MIRDKKMIRKKKVIKKRKMIRKRKGHWQHFPFADGLANMQVTPPGGIAFRPLHVRPSMIPHPSHKETIQGASVGTAQRDEFDVLRDKLDVTRDEFDVTNDELDVTRDELDVTRDDFDVTFFSGTQMMQFA